MTELADREQRVAAELIERLLTDAAFRARFRRDPAGTCRSAGLDALAEEVAQVEGRGVMTLELRESRSSLAGVMLAAAMEGAGVAGFVHHVAPHLQSGGSSLNGVLSQVRLPAVRDMVAEGGAPAPVPQAGTPSAADAALPEPPASASDAPVARHVDPPAPASRRGGGGDGDGGRRALAQVADQAPAPVAGGPAPDPAQYGMAGTGGPVSPQAKAVLASANVTLDPNGKQDFAGGRIDPRLAAVVLKLAQDHKLSITCTSSDHPVNTTGGSQSNHYFGRGLDIGTVDGELVRAGSPAAREVAAALAGLDPSIRPTEIGSPFSIDEPGYFTDGDHQDHIHVAFDDPISPDWKPPPDLGGAATPDAQEPAPVSPAAVAPSGAAAPTPSAGALAPTPPGGAPAPKGRSTGAFLAAGPQARAAGGGAAPRHRTDAFLAARTPEAAPPSDAPPSPADQPASAPAPPPVELGGGPGDYPGDDAPKEEIALWMAQRAEKAGLPPELPVMAALVESNLQNLDHGDASSEGYFQMLTTLWNKGTYEGFQRDPDKQIQWFIDTASPLKSRFGGLPPTAQNLGTWVADTENPASQFRYKYAERFEEARALIERGKARAGAGTADPGAAAAGSAAADQTGAPAAGHGAAAAPDPAAYGLDGQGGTLTPEARALLANPHLHFDATGVADLRAGRIDPRVLAVMTHLSKRHDIVVTCMCSDHPRTTTGGSVSNHSLGRGADIGTIDGELVRPGSPAARELAAELAELETAYRPDEVGTPFQIGAPGFFTDGDHQDHIHVGFKQAIDPAWRPPADVSASDGPGAAPAGGSSPAGAPAADAPRTPPAGSPPAAVAGAGATAPPPPAADGAASPPAPADGAAQAAAAARRNRPTSTFLAADPKAAASAAGQGGRRRATNAFLAAQAPPREADAAATPPPAADAAAAAADLSGVSAQYPGDGAPREQVAAWMAKLAEDRGLPRELPLMASLVESGMRNLRYGDADSVGFFQMRASVWDKGAYAGYGAKPELQVKWFLDQAEAVKRQRLARGLPVDDPKQFGEWIADVERPAAQYRGRYQLRLGEAQNLLQRADASGPATPAAEPQAPDAPAPGAADAAAAAVGDGPGPKAARAIAEAKKYLGTPYHWGGSTPQSGFDCSGLMQWAYHAAGVDIPRVAADQMHFGGGQAVDRAHLRAGDLVGFADPSGYIHHIGMYLGDGKFLHAPHTGDVVKVSGIDEPYYKGQFMGGLRLDRSAGAAAAAPEPPAAAPQPVAAAAAAPEPPAAPERSKTSEFLAIQKQESSFHRHTAMFLKAVDPETARRHAAAAEAGSAAGPPPASAAPAPDARTPPAPGAGTPPADPPADPPAGRPDSGAAAAGAGGPAPPAGALSRDYPGDDASPQAIARWMAAHAEDAGLPPELPVMAALTESGLRNLDYGDASSVGFFQMLTTVWDKGSYAGYRRDAGKQLQWFIDHAVAVKKQRLDRGLPVDDPKQFGEWIADVERPAARFRDRYQPRLEHARGLLGVSRRRRS